MTSRTENLLKALINGESIEHEPQSRIEKALVACLNKSGSVGLPESQSRTESLLHLLADDLASGTGGGASAYTVTSVDELPSNAVDGSTAIVSSDSLIGEWLFIETPNFDVFKLPDNTRIVCSAIGVNDESGYFFTFIISKIEGSFVISVVMGNDEQYDLYYDDMWEGSSVIKFIEQDGLWANTIDGNSIYYPTLEEDFKSFFYTNTERLSGGYSLYTHENGEWVYKCEVV